MKAALGHCLYRCGAWRLQRWAINARHRKVLRILSAHRVIAATGAGPAADRMALRRGSLSRSMFERAVRHLEKGYRLMSMDDALDGVDRQGQVAANALVLTFDDAYGDVWRSVYPLLQEKCIPFTVFLASDWVDRKPDILTSEQVREMAQSELVTWGSHGVTHQAFTGLDDRELQSELVRSREHIAALTGRDVRYVCYPDGRYDERVRAAVQTAGYAAACATGRRVNTGSIDRFAMQRIPFEGEPLWRFAFRVAGRT